MDEVARFPVDVVSARAARHFVSTAIGDDGRGDADVAVLLASELASNAISHARSSFSVRVRCDPATIRVEVGDDDPTLPVPARVAADALSGRGLAMVEAMADRWGAEPTGAGKVVWFEVPGQI